MKMRIAFAMIIVAAAAFVRWPAPISLQPSAAPPAELARPGAPNPRSLAAEPVRGEPSQPSLPTSSPDEWTLKQVVEIQEALGSPNEATYEIVSITLFPALLTRDVVVAARLLATIGPSPLRDELLRQVAQNWSQIDASRALEWATKLSKADGREDAISGVCTEMAQSNPQAAIAAADRLGVGNDKGVLENLAQLWAATDLDAALAWAERSPPTPSRDLLLARVAYAQSHTQPLQAASLVVEKIRPGPVQDEAAIAILHQWALRDPAMAAAWLEKFPDGPLRQRGQEELDGIALRQGPGRGTEAPGASE